MALKRDPAARRTRVSKEEKRLNRIRDFNSVCKRMGVGLRGGGAKQWIMTEIKQIDFRQKTMQNALLFTKVPIRPTKTGG